MSRARRTVKCAFGMLAQKFSCTEISKTIVKSCCVLQNFIHHEDNVNFRGDIDDTINDRRLNMRRLSPTGRIMFTEEAIPFRDTLRDYFVSPGGAVEYHDRRFH